MSAIIEPAIIEIGAALLLAASSLTALCRRGDTQMVMIQLITLAIRTPASQAWAWRRS